MSPTTRNLELTWLESGPDPWPEDLGELLNEYPFERRIRDRLEEDDIRTRWDLEREDCRGALLARYGEQSVGWLQVHEPTEEGPLWIRRERLQRNRPDLRQRLYETLTERFPTRSWLVSQPTQNRTARQELSRFPGVRLLCLTLGFLRSDPDSIDGSPPPHPVLSRIEQDIDALRSPTTKSVGLDPGDPFFRRPLGPQSEPDLYLGAAPGSADATDEGPDGLLVWIPQDHPERDRIAGETEPVGKRAVFLYEPERV